MGQADEDRLRVGYMNMKDKLVLEQRVEALEKRIEQLEAAITSPDTENGARPRGRPRKVD